MSTTETAPELYGFAVYPADMGDSFDPFIIDVPTMGGPEVAARRAWWFVFHQLGPQGIEPEEFLVCEWINGNPGRLVDSGGFKVQA